MEKMTHEANTPSKPPNSPQGVQIPSPPSSSQQRRSSSPHRQAVAQKRSQKPAWDSWGFSELPSEAGTAALALGRNPDRAALKDLTASWSPTRQGFRKPELARSDDGFSRSHRRKASLQRSPRCQLSAQHVSKSKLYREEQTHKGRMQKGKQTHKGSTHHAPRAHPRSSSCSSAPHSFLQPILHSQYSNVLPDDKHDSGTESKRGDSGQSEAFKPRRKAKGSRKAAQHAKHAAVTGKEQEDRSPDLALPRVIATNSQGQGSYISPLQSPNRGQPRMNRSPAAGDSSFIIFPEAQHGRDPAQASDSDASAQQSLSQRSGQTTQWHGDVVWHSKQSITY